MKRFEFKKSNNIFEVQSQKQEPILSVSSLYIRQPASPLLFVLLLSLRKIRNNIHINVSHPLLFTKSIQNIKGIFPIKTIK